MLVVNMEAFFLFSVGFQGHSIPDNASSLRGYVFPVFKISLG